VPIKKQEGLVRRPEEFATRKQYEKYLDETLGPSDDVFGSPIKEDLLKEWDKVKAKNVTPKKEGILATDEAAKIVKKRTDDIATGDPTGETSEIMEGLATSINKLKKSAKELEKTKIDPLEEMIKMQKVQQSMMKGGDTYKQGNIRTAVREFMKSEVKAGRLKLNETDSFRVREYSPLTEDDPIDVFRRWYGEGALEKVDEIGNVFEKGESFKHYEQLLRENVGSEYLTVKKTGAGKYDPGVMGPAEERKLMEKIRKDKEQKELLEDFDIDPDRQPNAYGGIAGTLRLNRTGFKVGGIKKGIDLVAKYGPEFKKFADMLFIKASNMIRQGKGMWKGLDQKQMMQQHDNLTKKVNTFQKEGTLEGMDQYFGIDAEKAFVETQAKVSAGQSKSINISDDAVAADFTNFIKKTDPEGYKKLEQTVELSNAKLGKGRKPNAEGGRVGMAKGGLPNILKL